MTDSSFSVMITVISLVILVILIIAGGRVFEGSGPSSRVREIG